MTTAPGCTTPGVRTYTCTQGDSTYTEAIPATGHIWKVKQEVKTAYDENGNLVTQGYTIYKCSVCGEEYKTADGTAPPSGGGSGSGSIDGNSRGLFKGIFGTFWDFCFFNLDFPGKNRYFKYRKAPDT